MSWEYLVGDAREVLAGLPALSVQCIVTSPPYWGLRDYGIPPSIWGGLEGCEHEWGEENTISKDRQHLKELGERLGCGGGNKHSENGMRASQGAWCQRCGAWRGCLGLEPTPEMFIEHMVLVCQDLWRVLRDDGTLWLNLGDCYSSGGRGYGGKHIIPAGRGNDGWHSPPPGLKHKDLVMMPQRVAQALQADGWWVRSKVIWFKKNPMPESCTDRPTSSYEEIFLLTKSGKPTYWVNAYREKGARKQPKPDYLYFDLKNDITYEEEPEGFDPKAKDKDGKPLWKRENQWRGHDYFYDADAVRETFISEDHSPRTSGTIPGSERTDRHQGREFFGNPMGRNLRNVWEIDEDEFLQFLRWKADHQGELKDVWKMATQSYPQAHFATFPEKIPELCIKAGTSERGRCPQCGAPWERVVEKEYLTYGRVKGPEHHSVAGSMGTGWEGVPAARAEVTTKGFQPTCECVEDWKRRCGADKDGEYHGKAIKDYEGTGAENPSEVKARILAGMVPKVTKGFQPTCSCPKELEPVPCMVLDPFAGTFTTGKMARDLGRSAIGIDISAEYRELAEDRAMLKTPDILTFNGGLNES